MEDVDVSNAICMSEERHIDNEDCVAIMVTLFATKCQFTFHKQFL